MASAGTYKGVNINPGTDEEVAKQVRDIDRGTITSGTLTPVPEIRIPETPVATEAAGLEGMISANADQFTRDLEQKAKDREKAKDESLSGLVSLLEGQEGLVARTTREYERGGVDELELELKDINHQILQEQEALRRRVERIQTSAGTATIGERQRELGEVERVSLRKQADLSIIQLARQGRYDSAKAIADRAVAAQLEEQRIKIDLADRIYEENKQYFNEADRRLFDSIQADRMRAFQREERELQTISDLSIEALQNGAPAAVASQMRQAKTVQEAIALGGQYVGLLDRQLKQAQIAATGRSNRGGSGGGGVSSGIRESIVDAANAVEAGEMTYAQARARLRTLYSAAEISDANLTNMLDATLAGGSPEAAAAAVEVSPIEQRIEQLSSSGILTPGDVRQSLRSQGFSEPEIRQSSAKGGVIDQLGYFLFGR